MGMKILVQTFSLNPQKPTENNNAEDCRFTRCTKHIPWREATLTEWEKYCLSMSKEFWFSQNSTKIWKARSTTWVIMSERETECINSCLKLSHRAYHFKGHTDKSIESKWALLQFIFSIFDGKGNSSKNISWKAWNQDITKKKETTHWAKSAPVPVTHSLVFGGKEQKEWGIFLITTRQQQTGRCANGMILDNTQATQEMSWQTGR